MPMGRLETIKPWLFVLTPVLISLVCIYMEELLAARALGGLLLLIPAPILTAARLNDSPLSGVMTVVAYITAVKGISLVLSPYLLRKVSEMALKTDIRARALGAVGVGFDAFLLVLAFTAY